MKYLLFSILVVSTSASFLARVRNHWEEKTRKPECHLEFEDVTEPQCETSTEQVCWEELKNQCKTEYSTSCQTEYSTKCKTEYEELCEIVEREQCHTEHEEQCHDEFVEECKTEYTEECQDEPEEKCHTETSQECTTEYDEVCSIDYEQPCHQEWVEKCKEVPDCRTEWQEECHTVQVKVDDKPKVTKWKRHAVDEMETADVEEESLEGRRKRSLATAAAVFGAGAVKATVVGAAAGAAIGGVVLPGAIGYGLGRKVGAGARKLVQIKSDLVQRKRDRFGRSVYELAEEEIVDMDMERLKELSEDAEEERGTAAEAISRQKRTIPGLGAVAAAGTGPLVAGHFAKKLGFKAGLHHALKGKDVKQALVKKPTAKVEKDPVCKQVPVERCTTSKQCDQVQVEKCEKVPVETCDQVPNTKCRSIPQEICNVVTNTHCKKVPHQICDEVPHKRCESVPHKVCEIIPEEKCWKEPSETCWDEPVQKCHQVPEERCWQEPHQSCRDEPRDICHDKTVRLEKKVCVHETKKTEVPTW